MGAEAGRSLAFPPHSDSVRGLAGERGGCLGRSENKLACGFRPPFSQPLVEGSHASRPISAIKLIGVLATHPLPQLPSGKIRIDFEPRSNLRPDSFKRISSSTPVPQRPWLLAVRCSHFAGSPSRSQAGQEVGKILIPPHWKIWVFPVGQHREVLLHCSNLIE